MTTNIMQHPSIAHADDIKQICRPLHHLNINYFAHMKATNGKLVAGMASNPEFSKIYVDKKYYNADVHLALSNQLGQYILWDAFDYSDQTNQLKEDSIACGVDHVFTII